VQIWFEVQLTIKYYICSIQTLKMYKTCLLQKLALVIALALPAALYGQVPVDISSQKIISEGKVYFMHPVLKGQTLYSISRAYKVTIDDITRLNVVPPNGIQTEQVLKIPASEALTASQPKPQPKSQPQAAPANAPATSPAPAPAKTAEQNVTPPANQGITQYVTTPPTQPQTQVTTQTQSQTKSQTQSQTQPQTQSQTQSQTQPQPQTQPEAQPAAKSAEKKPVAKAAKPETHKVQKGESISSIARDHGVTERELKKANKGLLFPMPGMYLVIPVKQDGEEDSEKQEK